jgi:lysophospholipase L1-like esterase
VRWADALASRLAGENRALGHHVLAQPGATSADVLELQVPRAAELEPDLVSVVCGVNDVLLAPQPDFGRYAEQFKQIVLALRRTAPGVVVVTATCPNCACNLPLTDRVRERLVNAVDLLNEVTRSVASGLAVPYVDFGANPRPQAHSRCGVPCDGHARGGDVVDAFARVVDDALASEAATG